MQEWVRDRHVVGLVLLLAGGCAPQDSGDDTGDDNPIGARSVDLSGATALAFTVYSPEERAIWQYAEDTELQKVLEDGSVARLFPEGWKVGKYAVGPHRMLVQFNGEYWFPSAAEDPPVEGYWCSTVSFRLEAPEEEPLTCHLPIDLYEQCSDPENDPDDSNCGVTPADLDVGPDDVVWATWGFDPRNLYAYTDTEAIQVTPAGLLEVDNWPPIIAGVQGGAAVNADNSDIGLETYWLDGAGGADVAFVPNVGMVDNSRRTIQYGGQVLLGGSDGLGVLDEPTRAFVPFVAVSTFEGATPTAPVYDFMDGPTLYIRTGTTAAWRCDTAAVHCVEIPFDDPRRVLLSSAMTSVSDGTISWIKTNQQEEYFATDTLISEDVTNTLHTQDVRVLDGHLHFVAVGTDNVAHLYRVDVVNNAFVYTETETWGPETIAIIPLSWP